MPRDIHHHYKQVKLQPFVIWEMVYNETGMKKQDIVCRDTSGGNGRKFEARMAARRLFAKIAREANYSFPRIGKHLNRDHTTVRYYLGLRKR